MIKQTGKYMHGLLPSLAQRELQRTPEWIEPTPVAAQEGTEINSITESFSTTNLDKSTPGSAFPRKNILLKPKTKSQGAPSVSKLGDTMAIEETAATQYSLSRITIGKRAYKVFATIFRSPTEDGVPGELPWMDFLHALSSVGFSVEKLDCSAWIFRPTHEAPERSIIYHEPHPASKIPFRMARRYGRRLERAYGWTKETFVRA